MPQNTLAVARFLRALSTILPIGIVLATVPLARAAERQVLTRSYVPAAALRLSPIKNLEASQRLKLAISLPTRNSQALDQLLQQLYEPTSPSYRQWWTPAQLAEQFGATPSDVQAVRDWAKAHNLAVTVSHPNRLVVDVEGTVGDIQKAFHVALHVYNHPTEARTFFAPDTKPSVDLAVPLLSVSGLDNYSIPHPMHHVQPLDGGSTISPRGGSGPSGTYAGCDFRAAYAPGVTLDGTGQSVGVLQFDGYYPSDIAAYATQFGLPSIPLVNVPVDGGPGTPGSGNGEVCLDIEMVMAMAPGVSTIYVYEAPNPSPWIDLLSKMQTDNLSKQLSCSWGGGPPDASSENVFKLMAAQGQSFFNATGDSDAFTGAIDFPSDSTNITEVGGTTLSTSGACGSYVSETVWNWGGGTGSSGGTSTYYGIPSYQAAVNMAGNQGSSTMRNVPDVALTADNVFVRYNNGASGNFGGTSCAAPLWAGFTALINQQAVIAARPTVGFLNPAIYTIGLSASYTSDFHDTVTGNNFSPSSPSKFSATTGYDLCTGWGTPRGANLINALAGPAVIAPLLIANGFTLVQESCTNNAIDAGETVTVSFALKNIGSGNTTNLVATLQASGGVATPSGPQSYGVLLASGGTASKSFTFTATGTCGATNTATLQLQDGPTSLGTVTFSFKLGLTATSTIFSENFDGVTAPALPAGWATSASGADSPWVTVASTSDTVPNSAFVTEPAAVGLTELDSPPILLPSGPTQLTFRNNYSTECTYDGGVLEIAIAGGAWTDILAAGGSFVTGGYDGVLSTSFSNPLGGRQAWNCDSGGFITTTVNLPPAAAGQSIQLRWVYGSDDSVSAVGWYIDSISITSSTQTCCVQPPVITSVSRLGTQLTLNWTAINGRTYQVLYKTSLAQPTWSLLTTLTATGSTASTADTIVPGARYYRVALLP